MIAYMLYLLLTGCEGIVLQGRGFVWKTDGWPQAARSQARQGGFCHAGLLGDAAAGGPAGPVAIRADNGNLSSGAGLLPLTAAGADSGGQAGISV